MRRINAAVGVGVALSFVWLVPGHQYDFNFEWLTARAFLSGVNPHLPVNELAEVLGFTSKVPFAAPRLPGILILQAPFGLIPFEYMYHAGRLITVATALWLGWLVSRWRGFSALWSFTLLPVFLLVWPGSRVLMTSQYSSLIVAGLIGVTVLSRDGWLSGAPLGVAVSFKLWPWLIVPGLWLVGRRRSALSATAAFCGLNAVGLLLPHVSVESTLFALNSVSSFNSWSILTSVGWPLWVGIVLGAVFLVVVRQLWPRYVIVASIPIALVVAPMLWPEYLPVLVVPMLVVWQLGAEGRSRFVRETGNGEPSARPRSPLPPAETSFDTG